MILALLITVPLVWWYATKFLPWAEDRPELVEIPDPLFRYFPRFDASWPINILHYVAIGTFVCHLISSFGQTPNDDDVSRFLWAYSCVILYRTLVLYLHPFRVHHEVVPLVDTILMTIIHRDEPGKNLLNDLSFSGHTSLYGLFALIHPSFMWFYFVVGILVSFFMCCGRIHYSADLLIGPVFSFASYHSSFHLETMIAGLAAILKTIASSYDQMEPDSIFFN